MRRATALQIPHPEKNAAQHEKVGPSIATHSLVFVVPLPREILNQPTRDSYTQAARLGCVSVAMFSTVTVTSGAS